MRVVAIVGHKGSGKTTLIERLIGTARGRGLTVSTVKHAHHHAIELDTPGKDSFRHRQAGASEVIVASDKGWARITASPDPASLQVLLGHLRPVDLVIVEGYKQLEWLRRVEVFRGDGTPLVCGDPAISAIACPAGVPIEGFRGVRLPLEDASAVLDFILDA